MKKFEKNLTASNESIKGTRAKLACDAAEAATEKIIAEIKDRKRKLEMKLAKLDDLNPDTTVSLNVSDNFNPDTWASEMQNTKVALVLVNGELKVAQETMKDYFTE